MARNRLVSEFAAFEELVRSRKREHYVLRLYVTGLNGSSMRAVANLRALCEEHLTGRYELTVVDLYQQPEMAHGSNVVAAPTLVKELPLPERRLIGDMSDARRVLVGLDVRAKRES